MSKSYRAAAHPCLPPDFLSGRFLTQPETSGLPAQADLGSINAGVILDHKNMFSLHENINAARLYVLLQISLEKINKGLALPEGKLIVYLLTCTGFRLKSTHKEK